MFRPIHTRQNALCWLFLLFSFGGLSGTTHAVMTSNAERTIVLRADSPERSINPQEFELSLEHRRANVVSVRDSSEAHLTMALVIDTGPNQSKVLEREKQLASSLVTQFADSPTQFVVVRGGYAAKKVADTSESQVAIEGIDTLTSETGKKSLIPIYKAIALAIGELSLRPGIRVLIVIAEGNDSGSGIRYKQLRASAQAQHISVTTALVASHSTRGSKAILSYGWDLQSLAGDTAGIFVDNDRNTRRVTDRLTRMIRSLRLVTFEFEGPSPGSYRVSTSASSVGRLHAQKFIVIEGVGGR